MDLYCPKCGEPWDNDTFHEVAEEIGSSYRAVAADFRKRGCPALQTECGPNKANPAVAELYHLLGDDMDGAASMLDDMQTVHNMPVCEDGEEDE